MIKGFKLFLLIFALTLWSAAEGTAAYAGTVTGMVGVGTWNTQADFDDVQVVQGTTTLYQSNFSGGMSEWKTVGGAWQTTSSGYLRQTGASTPALAFVGDPSWSNYTVTLRARKNSGAEGFLIAFGSPGDATHAWWNIGGWGNTLAAVQMPGVYYTSVPKVIQTGVWYDIRIEVIGSDIRCYLNGTLVQDTSRIIDAADRTSRFQALQSSAGYGLLNSWEKQWLNNLAARKVYVGDAARETFLAMPSTTTFNTLSASQQEAIIRQVNRNRLTWLTGSGFGSDAARDAAIIAAMDSACILHNQNGLYDGNFTVNNNPSTPTADAAYGGPINFGSQYSERTALHELSHALGTGTFWKWNAPVPNGYGISGGKWQGFYGNDQLDAFDGDGAVLSGDTQHYWPYGLNYDTEWSTTNGYRHVMMVEGLRRDMGIATLNVEPSIDIPNDTYALVPRHATASALDVQNAGTGNGNPIDIHTYTGADSQRFLLDLQSDSAYRIRTVLAGNRALDLTNWSTTNGNLLQLHDNNGFDPQRWFIIPTDSGYFRISPKLNIAKSVDVVGVHTADGTLVDNWDYLDNFGQQWKLVPSRDLYTTLVQSGTYTLTPQNAPGSVLDAQSAAKGAVIDIHTYTAADSQQFLLDLQSDGTYRIRTAQAGNRCLDLTNSSTANGNKLQLNDATGLDPQRWYLIPMSNGYYKIAPKINIDKSLEASKSGTADGTIVDNWDYLGGANQLWKLSAPTNPTPAVTALSPAKAVAGSASFPLTVTGSGFMPTSAILWNGTALATTYVSPTQLTTTVPGAAVTGPATTAVTVSTPAPGGGPSSPMSFVSDIPSLKYTRGVISRSGSDLTVTVTLSNVATIDAPAVSVTTAAMTLGGKTIGASGLPQTAGSITAGGSGVVTLVFPGAGSLTGSTAVLRISGSYAATGAFTVTGSAAVPH